MAHSSSTYADAGGFFPPSTSLPSPSPSTASSRAAAGLPQPRSKPLAPGSRKEDYARNYVSARLLHVSRRYVKHFGLPEAGDDAATAGYSSFDEVCADLDDIVVVLWFSGTPTLQVPYLLSVALAVREYASAFAPAPRPTFALLRKLDHCFASLLAGRDARSGAPLPGFNNGGGPARGMTRTDMVRCKSLAVETRSLIAVLMSGEADVENYAPEDDDEENIKNKNRENRPTPTLARPGKRGRDELEEATTPAGLGRDVDDIDDDDDDDTEEDVRTENSSPKRRRSDTPPKRPRAPYIKDEEEASLAALRSPHPGGAPEAEAGEHATPSTATGATADKQFHWALEDDDLSDDEEDDKEVKSATGAPLAQQPPTPATATAAAVTGVGIPVPRSAGQPQTPPSGAVDADMADVGVEGDDDEDEEADEGGGEEEDEEEELHMNVAKVYEKTLVELGRVLDEPLVDD